MRFIFIFVFSMFSLAALALPEAVQGQAGLVTCQGLDCDACKLADMVNKIIKWMIGVMVLVAVILLVVAGFKLLFSAGKTEALTSAKNMFVSVVIGFILVLAAWLIVDTILQGLTGKGLNALGPITCGEMFVPVENETGGRVNVTGKSVTPDLNGMVSLNAAGVNVANEYHGINGPDRYDKAHPEVVAAVKKMQDLALERFGVQPFQVTAAYTEGVGHSKGSKHYDGIAVDLDPINGFDPKEIVKLANEVGFTYIKNETSHIHVDMR